MFEYLAVARVVRIVVAKRAACYGDRRPANNRESGVASLSSDRGVL